MRIRCLVLVVLLAGCGGGGGHGHDEASQPLRAWAVASDAVIRSEDAGHTWDVVLTPAERGGFAGLTFLDRSHGWAVGTAGIFRTQDGGDSWTIQRPFTTEAWGDVAFVAAKRGVVVGTTDISPPLPSFHPAILLTDDAGAHFTTVTRLAGTGIFLTRVCFTSGGTGLAIGAGTSGAGIVLLSADAGASWEDVSARIPFPGASAGLACVAEAELWIVGRAGPQAFHSTDAGRTWTDVSAPVRAAFGPSEFQQDLAGVAFVDPSRGWAVGSTGRDPTIIHTSDGGVSWQREHITLLPGVTGTFLLDVAVASDGIHGVAVGPDATHTDGTSAAGVALVTEDGASWDQTPVPAVFDLRRVVLR